MFRTRLNQTAVAAIICAILVYFSVEYVDRPVAKFAFQHRVFAIGYEILASPSLASLPFANIYLIIYAYRTLSGRPPGAYTSLFLTLSVAIVIGTFAKDELKWLIGRPWPSYWWTQGIYQVSPFTDNEIYGSFPSGHTTYIAAPMFVFWWRLPSKYRPVWMALITVVMIGLVGYGFHFVADVIAGFFVGMAAAAIAVSLIPQTPLPPQVFRRS